MLVNLDHKHLMIIICQLGLKLNIQLHMFHIQNGLVESFIKRLQLIVRPLLMKTKLPTSIWGHAILHAASLVRIRPTAYLNIHLCNLHLVMNLIFLTYGFLVVLSKFLFHPHDVLKWVPNENLRFMWILIHHLLLDILNL